MNNNLKLAIISLATISGFAHAQQAKSPVDPTQIDGKWVCKASVPMLGGVGKVVSTTDFNKLGGFTQSDVIKHIAPNGEVADLKITGAGAWSYNDASKQISQYLKSVNVSYDATNAKASIIGAEYNTAYQGILNKTQVANIVELNKDTWTSFIKTGAEKDAGIAVDCTR